ncbi:MAG: DUF177 domain-containing protein [Clostridiales bacterium]|nr:DUF177 domain-containing protein [Clostridiales bacterium]
MKFDLNTIKRGEIEKADLEFTIDFDSIDYYGDILNIIKPIEVKGTIYNVGKRIFLTSNIKAELEVNCGRCLKDFIYPMTTKMNVELIEEGEINKDNDMDDIIVYEDNIIDFDIIIKEEIIANTPMKALCSDDCKGLCSTCGANLNLNTCQCNSNNYDNIDPRLEKLKQLLD